MVRLLGVALFAFVALAGCQSVDQPPPAEESTGPEVRQIHVNGTDLTYLVQGRGIPIVFVHGALSDYRFWEGQQAAFAAHYRFIALNLRYHGAAPWADNGKNYSEMTHEADLVAFIRALDLGPVYLVGASYGANIALAVALDHPDLVFGLIMEEPAAPQLVSGPKAKAALGEARRTVGNVRAMLRGGDPAGAARLYAEWARNLGRGSFEKQTDAFQAMVLDNARTVRPYLDRIRLPAPSCARLGLLQPSALIINGEKTRPFFALSGEAMSRCIRGSHRVMIPGATHGIAEQDPAAFNAAVLNFLSKN